MVKGTALLGREGRGGRDGEENQNTVPLWHMNAEDQTQNYTFLSLTPLPTPGLRK